MQLQQFFAKIIKRQDTGGCLFFCSTGYPAGGEIRKGIGQKQAGPAG
jgi:hypothetical protein